MARSTTVIVPAGELAGLFEALDLWPKIHQGILRTVEKANKTAPSKSYPGGTSQILAHYNAAGAHACTTHRIIDALGRIVHWDEADIKVGDATLAKLTVPGQDF